MATFKHEVTNRKAKVAASMHYYKVDWMEFKSKYNTKCSACKQPINQGDQILWHKERKIVMHKNC